MTQNMRRSIGNGVHFRDPGSQIQNNADIRSFHPATYWRNGMCQCHAAVSYGTGRGRISGFHTAQPQAG